MKDENGFALYQVKEGHGYVVEICTTDGTVLERYTAGDSKFDSQVYGTGQLNKKQLKELAIQTAKELMIENNIQGKIAPSTDLFILEEE
jgi:hypothetical protein